MWYFKLGVTVLLAFIAQTSLFHSFEILSIVPNLLVVLVICFSLVETNLISSSVFGLICGLLLDVADNGEVFGVGALLCMLLALLCTCAGEKLFKGKFWVSMLFVFVASLLYEAVYYVLFLGMWQSGYLLYSLLHVVIPTAVYNLVVAVPLFLIVKRIRPVEQ